MSFGFGSGPARRGRLAAPERTPDEALVIMLYQEYGRALLGYSCRLCRDQQQAEDIVQETLLRAWRQGERLSADRGSVRAWLFTVARNVWIDMVRARQVRPVEVDGKLAEVTGVEPLDDPAREMDDKLTVEKALASLSVEHRAVLVEVYLKDKSAQDAGAALGIPPGTVKSRTYYALRALRGTLGQEVSA
ncbi:RNA polymerase sigma-70 factor [Jatrophihabitans sp. GAS493]|uniref:sigma-70 family RNA polymerase sigma factor n=1 Tax=Jatrophihabitans sp. GAS493 TaxID=1907575 RepID=UPI000BB7599C|nr:sigma-70 family RNA polymerase sigma factor [Jatrophihabitans sp. GAS493]SOD75045.1 RNA polymerase sigma-70 factor [Jatrophihabitans sp. GAS493]